LVGAFKTVSTKRINEIRNTSGAKLWQRKYDGDGMTKRRRSIRLRGYVVMPNHMHGIIVITDVCRGGSRTAPTVEHGGDAIMTGAA